MQSRQKRYIRLSPNEQLLERNRSKISLNIPEYLAYLLRVGFNALPADWSASDGPARPDELRGNGLAWSSAHSSQTQSACAKASCRAGGKCIRSGTRDSIKSLLFHTYHYLLQKRLAYYRRQKVVVSGSNCEGAVGRPSVAAPRSADQFTAKTKCFQGFRDFRRAPLGGAISRTASVSRLEQI
jgi:hypothetical protein